MLIWVGLCLEYVYNCILIFTHISYIMLYTLKMCSQRQILVSYSPVCLQHILWSVSILLELCKLEQARCAVVAVANPIEGRYDQQRSCGSGWKLMWIKLPNAGDVYKDRDIQIGKRCFAFCLVDCYLDLALPNPAQLHGCTKTCVTFLLHTWEVDKDTVAWMIGCEMYLVIP